MHESRNPPTSRHCEACVRGDEIMLHHTCHHVFQRVRGMGMTHCCACLADAKHKRFDATGCEWCDRTAVLATDGKAIFITGPDHEPEFRFDLTNSTGRRS